MRIGLTGTMSVGKTTLVNQLIDLPEFNGYTKRTERSKYLMEMGIPLNTDSTLKGQTIFLAERASELMQENIITDRTVIDVMAFTFLSQSMTDEEKKHFIKLASNLIPEYDVIVYVSPKGIPIEDNSVRETDPFYRNQVDSMIRSFLIAHEDKILTDRTVIDVMAFTFLSQSMTNKEKKHFLKLAADLIPEYDVIVYLSPNGIPIEDNSVRETNPFYRDQVDSVIRSFLQEHRSKINSLVKLENPNNRLLEFKERIVWERM